MPTRFNGLTRSQVVNGQLKESNKQYHSINPFTEEQLWPVPVATEGDLDEAVAAANVAFKKWRLTTIEERRECIKAFADALMAQKDEWSEVITKEAGQPVRPGARSFCLCYGFQLMIVKQKELADEEVESGVDFLIDIRKICGK